MPLDGAMTFGDLIAHLDVLEQGRVRWPGGASNRMNGREGDGPDRLGELGAVNGRDRGDEMRR